MAHQSTPPRIVSLIASSTEIICALGFEDKLVARSHECDFPETVKRLPVTTAPKFKIEGSSLEIDNRVKELVREGLSVYRVDPDKLNAAAPDLIVTQIQCEVCAVSQKDVEAAVCNWVGSKPRIVSLNPVGLNDIFTDIEKVGQALGAQDRAAALTGQMKTRMRAVETNAAGAARAPKVAYIEWIEPVMAGGNWMPDLVRMAGGENLFGRSDTHSPFLDWNEVVKADPEIIFVAPCGFDVARTLEEMRFLTGRPGWEHLQAVRNRRVIVADGNQYFNRPGPRIVESLEILAEVIHPDRFGFGHEGKGWVRFTR